MSGIPSVYAESDNEAWSAGAIETAVSFFIVYKSWYWPLYTFPVHLIFFGLCGLPFALENWLSVKVTTASGIAYLLSLAVSTFVYLGRERLFPAVRILFKDEPNFIRKYYAEITLLLTVSGLIVSIIALLK